MAGFTLSSVAADDIQDILVWTHDNFGEPARRRYEALLIRAIKDVSADPELAGSSSRPELARAARTYHLLHSRNHVPTSTGRVKQPRHFLLYRVRSDGHVEIGRILHDSMDLERHLPEDYRP